MLPRVIAAYADNGYRVDLGNPHRLYGRLCRTDTQEDIRTGGGMSISDCLFFVALAKTYTPASVFVVGNAFGLSTFVLADLFPSATVDVIDAEVEGQDNALGSTLTRTIAAKWFPNVRLTTGFSPQDVKRASRCSSYQLVFIDGLHTNEQMYSDFVGLQSMFDSRCVVVFHDVAICEMMEAWQRIQTLAEPDGFRAYELAFTQFGVCAIARGLPGTQSYLDHVAGRLSDHQFHLGVPRRRIWQKSPYDLMRFLRRKLRR